LGDLSMANIEIKKGIYFVGVKDSKRKLFDSLIPLPNGTSYNSYLVKGKDKIALIDTVNPGFEKQLADNIGAVVEVDKIDYLIMNHAEPDHAGAIPFIMKSSKATLITTEKGANIAKKYHRVSEERIKIVKDKDKISLGGKTLEFIEAPWLHWPETMFTYVIEDKTLFSCDFFGSHTAVGFYAEDSENLLSDAKKYFGEIMMPFKTMGAKALEKIEAFDIQMIAPSHGPIYKNPEQIIKLYKEWTSAKTKKKVIVVYVTMWNSTEKMVQSMIDTLAEEDIEVCSYNLANADIGDIAKDLVDSRAIVLGSPTVLGSIHPLALHTVNLVKALRPPAKYAVFLNSYGWGPATKVVVDALSNTQIEIVGAVKVNWVPEKEDLQKVHKLGKDLAQKIKG